MPRGDGTGPMGRGAGTGRGGGGGFGGKGGGMGRGRMGGNRLGAGPAGKCICPNCSATVPHRAGAPCYTMKCPKCGTHMVRG